MPNRRWRNFRPAHSSFSFTPASSIAVRDYFAKSWKRNSDADDSVCEVWSSAFRRRACPGRVDAELRASRRSSTLSRRVMAFQQADGIICVTITESPRGILREIRESDYAASGDGALQFAEVFGAVRQ